MASVLVRDVSPELEASIRGYAEPRGLSMSQAALTLIQLGLNSDEVGSISSEGVRATDYVTETLKEVLHTKDEAEEFIRNRG
jgi:hypothetical protein